MSSSSDPKVRLAALKRLSAPDAVSDDAGAIRAVRALGLPEDWIAFHYGDAV